MNCLPSQTRTHRRLADAVQQLPYVASADVLGPDDAPAGVTTTEIVLVGVDTAPPALLLEVADVGLGIRDTSPQGEAVYVEVR